MENSLQELLVKYVKENKFADLEYAKSLLNILIDTYGDNGLRNVEVCSLGKSGYSDFIKGSIFIDLEFIKEKLLNEWCCDDIKSNLYLVNIYVMLVLIHEFNHFKQTRKFERIIESNDFLDKLFVNSFVFLCSNNLNIINKYNHTKYRSLSEVNDFYNEYHDCFVIERLAQLEAYNIVIKVIESISLSIRKVYYWFLISYYSYKIREYYELDDGILSPIDLLLSTMIDDGMDIDSDGIMEESTSLKSDNFYDELISLYSVSERIGYGLPITEKEYYDMVSYINLMYMLGGNKGVSLPSKNITKKKTKDINNY